MDSGTPSVPCSVLDRERMPFETGVEHVLLRWAMTASSVQGELATSLPFHAPVVVKRLALETLDGEIEGYSIDVCKDYICLAQPFAQPRIPNLKKKPLI